MKHIINIPSQIASTLRTHLFQSEVEQGAFLFARVELSNAELRLEVEDCYLVPAKGWEVQMDIYLQMRDSERAKIMKLARDKNLAAIDCHSHPHAGSDVWFSPSDVAGITEFAQYAKWKLTGKPFAAMVWGEASVDAVVWKDDFAQASKVHEVRIIGGPGGILYPTESWFHKPRAKHRFIDYE